MCPRSSDPFYVVTWYIYNGSLLLGHTALSIAGGEMPRGANIYPLPGSGFARRFSPSLLGIYARVAATGFYYGLLSSSLPVIQLSLQNNTKDH